jgi:hypothetical protein
MLPEVQVAAPFRVTVEGRQLSITPGEVFGEREGGATYLSVPVDCRDAAAGCTSQAIVDAADAASPAAIIGDSQVRDAIASAYFNATQTALPHGFGVQMADQ